MARAFIAYQFADGDRIQVVISGKNSYPDALSQLKHEAVDAFRQAMNHALGVQAPKPEPMPSLEDE